MRYETVQTLSDADFKRSTGVRRDTFEQMLEVVTKGLRTFYSGPVKLDTESGCLKVYNYGHAQTLYHRLQSSSCTRTP